MCPIALFARALCTRAAPLGWERSGYHAGQRLHCESSFCEVLGCESGGCWMSDASEWWVLNVRLLGRRVAGVRIWQPSGCGVSSLVEEPLPVLTDGAARETLLQRLLRVDTRGTAGLRGPADRPDTSPPWPRRPCTGSTYRTGRSGRTRRQAQDRRSRTGPPLQNKSTQNTGHMAACDKRCGMGYSRNCYKKDGYVS